MSKKNYFTQYKTPNTIIVPTAVCYPPSPKRPKVEVPLQSQSPQHVDLSFLDDFNIDEILDCLYNCDSNDRTLQEKENDPNSSLLASEHNAIVLSNESSTNVVNNHNNNGNNEEKYVVSGSDTKNVLNITLNTNQNVEESYTTNIINSDNVNGNQDGMGTTEILVQKSQSDHVLVDNISSNNHEIQSNSKEIDCEGNNMGKNEFNDIKNNICSVSNIPTLLNNNIVIAKDKKYTNIIQKEVLNPNDIIKKKESQKQIIFNKHNTVPINTVQCKTDKLCKELGRKMSYYLHTKYWVQSVTHHGKFSRIFTCQDSAGEKYAVKMLNNKSDKFFLGIKKGKMLMEIQADIPRDNLFCVYLKNTFCLNGYWCFLMEFFPTNLEIAMERKPFHINMVQDLARQLVAAVTLLRNNEIVHSDIKPSHILLNSSNTKLKLCGFDSSYYICEVEMTPNIGSISYRAPEVILGYSAGFSIDVWSTALILYEMATGQKLFPGYCNWDILYRQMCTLGDIPLEMLSRSYYSNKYFDHGTFKKKNGRSEEKMVKNIFKRSNKISKTVYDAYYEHWAPSRTKMQKSMDVQKIHSLLSLLDQMLVMYPNNRLPIEFVYSNPFIYEMFDC
ncbi:serine/threonine-protein kinase PRP4 homolog isoform X2 [Vanessa atalanta]|uniref:serine/threonine-protein kinase PRP4 homolog isoform X2 n=1 Tax=Vanessa atalanta TaxID=42275 RepID=UPI001FCCDC7E|nr:serine/threonine-protein kinase PRP4 homolog isoform X2 [Vanessa atalanta]